MILAGCSRSPFTPRALRCPLYQGILVFDLLLRRARLADDTLTDIAIQDGKIAATGDIDAPARKTVELNGDVFVSAGWIDSTSTATRTPDLPRRAGQRGHCHRRHHRGGRGQHRRRRRGTILRHHRKASTEVFALLNISRVGLIAQNELAQYGEY